MSFAAKVEKLMFTVGLTDKTAAPIGAIDARIDKLANNAQKGFRNIGYGAAGIAGAVLLLNRAMAPAIEQMRAINEVSSLDVEPKALKNLNKMALATQAQFGLLASDIALAGYEIKSGVKDLNDINLTPITRVAAILGKATKDDAVNSANYLTAVHGLNLKLAKEMGDVNFFNQLAGQSAAAVQMFRTTGGAMKQAFQSAKSSASAANVPLYEQIAALGTLQGQMDPSTAGTSYAAAYTKFKDAEKALGIQFYDNNDKILPIDKIMSRITSKYTDLSKGNQANAIQKAFGETASAAIFAFAKDVDGLSASMSKINDASGLEKTLKMASAMTDPWQQLTGTVNSVHTAFSMALIPVLQPTIDKITEAGTTLLRWTNMFPHLTSAVATVGMAVVGLIATIAALTVAVGIYRFMAVGWAVIHTVLTGGMWLLSAAVGVVSTAYKFARASMLGFYLLSVTSGGALAALRVIMLSLTTGVWAFTTALLANPITWLVVGVVALGAALVAAVVYWDDIKNAAGAAIEWISAKLTAFTDFIGNLNPMEMLGDSIDWLIDKINLIPGVDIETRFNEPAKVPSASNNQVQKLANIPLASAANQSYSNVVPMNVERNTNAASPLQKMPVPNNVVPLHLQRQINTSEPKREQLTNTTSITQNRYDIPKGGALSQIKQMNSETNNNGVSMGNVTIQTQQINDAEDLQQQLLLAAM
jgi:TP901 family phage tail tape measure protein